MEYDFSLEARMNAYIPSPVSEVSRSTLATPSSPDATEFAQL